MILEPQKSFRLEIPMEHYTREDFSQAQGAYYGSNALDITLYVTSTASAGFAGYQLFQAFSLYDEANSITNAQERDNYDQMMSQGDTATMMFIGGTALATTALATAIIHKLISTNPKRDQYRYIKLVTEE